MVAAADQGETSATEALFTALYAELHGLAKRVLERSGSGVTLGVTTLLHEAYVDISARDGLAFPDRGRFLAYAARVMRGLIIDFARERRALKRGGGFQITTLDTRVAEGVPDHEALTQLSEALDELAAVEPWLARIVDLKFFCGFSFAEIAAIRGVSERTVQRSWEKARLYLYRTLQQDIRLS